VNINVEVFRELERGGFKVLLEHQDVIVISGLDDDIEYEYWTSDMNDTWTIDKHSAKHGDSDGFIESFDTGVPHAEKNAFLIACVIVGKLYLSGEYLKCL
jgi:hypothetical protein